MPKTPPPLLGFNNNVRHQGRVFHIQTEDSGVKRPHVITHLFADGGRILKTTRTDYAEHVGREDLAQVLRKIMKEQHKAMFIALRRGDLDPMIEEAFGPPPAAPAPSTPASELPSEPSAAPEPASPPEPSLAAPELAVEPPRPSTIPRAPSAPIIRESQPEIAPHRAAVGRWRRHGRGPWRARPTAPRAATARGPSGGAARRARDAGGGNACRDAPKSDPSLGRYSVKNPEPEAAGRYSVSRPCGDLRRGAAQGRALHLRRRVHRRKVPGRGDPQLPRRGPRESASKVSRSQWPRAPGLAFQILRHNSSPMIPNGSRNQGQ